MANLLQSCSQTQTQAPGYYNQYLNTLASCGVGAAKGAQFVGATPLQQQAFGTVAGAADSYKPGLQSAEGTLGAANTMATGQSPLASAQPYLQGATACLGARTTKLMNPYVHCVVNQINTLGQQNIQQNLAPQATAGAVGSGQFGSQRGAQVLGQTVANANQQILSQQANALMCGYKTALCGALKQGAICQQAGTTAANAASQGAQNLGNLAKVGACIASTTQQLGLQGVCAINKMGTNQQTILQNQQCFPLTELGKASGLLNGKAVPTTQINTATVSPLGAASGLASLLSGSNGSGGTVGSSILGLAKCAFNAARCYFGNSNAGVVCAYTPSQYSQITCVYSSVPCASCMGAGLTYARGGLVCGAAGCASAVHRGALPARR
jgi:hypothetical protein